MWSNVIRSFGLPMFWYKPYSPPKIDVAGWIRKIYDEAQRLLSQQWHAATGFSHFLL